MAASTAANIAGNPTANLLGATGGLVSNNILAGIIGGPGGAASNIAQAIANSQLQNQGVSSLAQIAGLFGTPANQGTGTVVGTQDTNNVSSQSWSEMANPQFNPSNATEATGAPMADPTGQGYATNRFGGFAGPTGGGTLTAGMAMGDAPIATVGGFNPQAQFAAQGIYGNEDQRRRSVNQKKLINF